MSSDAAALDVTKRPDFQARRRQNWVLVGLLYSLFYMSRYNFAAIAPDLMHVFGWTKAEHLSIFETTLPLAYGLSVVVNGPIADRFGGRRAFLFGASGAVLMNLLFGAACFLVITPAQWGGEGGKTIVQAAQIGAGLNPTSLAWVMAIVWGLNGYFQSFGALSIVKINAHWFPVRERGVFAAIFGVLIRLGLILAFSGCPAIVNYLPWQYAFWIPAALVAVVLVLVYFFVVDKPEDAGYPTVDTGDAEVETGEADGARPSVLAVLRAVLKNPVMWTIAGGSMMIGIVRRSIIDGSWWPAYMREVHHVGRIDLVYQVTAWGMALAGIAGGFVLGGMSDRAFHGRRAPVVVIGFVGMVGSLLAFLGSDALKLGPWGAASSIVLISFFINGAHGMIGGAASMDFGGKKGAATAAGLFDGMQYLAAAPVAGMFVPWVTEKVGWQAWKYLTIPWAIVGAILMLRIWNAMPGRRAH
jgi:OPA family glycerol-3-phosphate transporter-like MFS transporter